MTNYCTNCGTQLNENGMCPNCGAVYSTGIPQENQVYIDNNGVYVDANGNPIPPEQFQPVDLSGYYAVPQQEYVPNPEYPQQEYVPNPEYPQQEYVPNPEYPQQEYVTDSEYSRTDVQFTMPLPISEWWDCAKAFFTSEPSISVDKVMNGRNYSWAIFASLNAVAAALCTAGVIGNGFNKLIETIFGSYAFMINFIEEYSFGNMALLFFVSLISFIALFFAVSACEYVFLSAVQKKLSFEEIFKAVSISYFPMTIACVAAFVFSFFLLPMAALLLTAGFIAGFMLLNESTKKLVGDVPFWGLVLNNIAQVVIAMVIISIALTIAL